MTLAAVRGVEGVRGHKGGAGGINIVDRGGTNHWQPGFGSPQTALRSTETSGLADGSFSIT